MQSDDFIFDVCNLARMVECTIPKAHSGDIVELCWMLAIWRLPFSSGAGCAAPASVRYIYMMTGGDGCVWRRCEGPLFPQVHGEACLHQGEFFGEFPSCSIIFFC